MGKSMGEDLFAERTRHLIYVRIISNTNLRTIKLVHSG